MELDEYQNFARTTRLESADKQYAVLNLGGEVGELLSLYAKERRDGELNKSLVVKELGDILWHVAAIADDNGWSLDYIAKINLFKLNMRQKQGTLQGSGDER